MQVSDCFYVGYISKTFGYKGGITAFFDVDDAGRYESQESVFLLIEEKLIPFFIESIAFKPNSQEANIQFQGISSFEMAGKLIGTEMYLPLSSLPKLSGKQFYFHEIVGFTAIDIQRGKIGIIDTVIDLPGNPLLQIKEGFKEILVPARDEFIHEIDRDNRIITLDTPPGLLDLYE